MALFSDLYNLQLKSSNNSLEDYFTELVAFCFRQDPEFFFFFSKSLGIYFKIDDSYKVYTQYIFKALGNHNVDSKPDIVIFSENHTIIIENKIGAYENNEQLKRYSEHIYNMNKPGTLIYITRDFDPKNALNILSKCKQPPKVTFIHLRWYEFYRLIIRHNHTDSINHQILLFMKEHNLTQNNQFSPLDIFTLKNFSKVRSMMDETLSGEISAKFEKVTNAICRDAATMTQLKNHDRYIYFSEQHSYHFSILIGYWLCSAEDTDYPDVALVIEIGPNCPEREKIIEIFKEIETTREGWEGDSLNDPKAWSSIWYSKTLKDFIPNNDHVRSIKEFFLEAIIEVEKIMKAYPSLPWKK